MTTAFLVSNNGGVASMSKNLRETINYYASFFDPKTSYIEDLRIQSSHGLTDPMTVIDPLNRQNNVTKSAFRIGEIQEVFKGIYKLIINYEG